MMILILLSNDININFSILTDNLIGYILVLILCVLLSINLYISTKTINKKYILLSIIGPIIGGVLPYYQNSNSFISGLHEIFTYISFTVVNIITILNIYKYYLNNRENGKRMFISYITILFLDFILYLKTEGVIAIEEFILLSTILILNYLIYKSIKENLNNEQF